MQCATLTVVLVHPLTVVLVHHGALGVNISAPHMHAAYHEAAESAAVLSLPISKEARCVLACFVTLRPSLQVRLDAMGFNVSAPHMHATCLEALDLQPGHSFLDIGSGCGLVTAAAAFLVRPSCIVRLGGMDAPTDGPAGWRPAFVLALRSIAALTAVSKTALCMQRTPGRWLRQRAHGVGRWASRAARWASTSRARPWCWRGAAWPR